MRDDDGQECFTGPWKVQVLGEMGNDFELSVVREDFAHGQRSWGWPGSAKRIIADAVHGNEWNPPAEAHAGLRAVAESVAQIYNLNVGKRR